MYITPSIMCVQYIEGCSVHWRDTMSTSGISWVHWGCSVHRGDIMMHVGSKVTKAFQFILKTPMYWTSPNVLLISPICIMKSPDVLMKSPDVLMKFPMIPPPPMYSWYLPMYSWYPPMYSWYPPMYWTPTPMYWTFHNILNTRYTGCLCLIDFVPYLSNSW